MSTQQINDYKLNWLRNKCFRVPVRESAGEHVAWLEENLNERVWEMSINPDNQHHTFFFEDANDAEQFRAHFSGDSRTVDISL